MLIELNGTLVINGNGLLTREHRNTGNDKHYSQPRSRSRNRKLTRLQNYDYSQAGYYFVTICTYNRVNHFGEIDKD